MDSDDRLNPVLVGNGVVCHFCFKTIDLSALAENRKASRWWSLTKGEVDFTLVCPSCGGSGTYSYSEVHPLTRWASPDSTLQARLLQTRLKIVEAERDRAIAERDKARSDAKLLAQELHNKTPEEADQPSTLPKETAQKPPTPPEGPSPKKRDEKPDYLQ